MPPEPPSVYKRASRNGLTIEQEAKRLARHVLEEWTHSGSQDSKALEDGLQRAFLDEANHCLRQVLFQLGARLELAMVKGAKGLDERTADGLMNALNRATQIVDVYLDRSRAVQYAITLHPEPFRLDEDVLDVLTYSGFMEDQALLSLDLLPVSLVADRQRLRDVLGHLMARFWFSRTPEEHLVVRIHPSAEGGVDGFIGLSQSHQKPEDLIEEFSRPLSIEEIKIDTPYTRAVMERHGGSLYVASDTERAIGFGFRLPSRPPQDQQTMEDDDIVR